MLATALDKSSTCRRLNCGDTFRKEELEAWKKKYRNKNDKVRERISSRKAEPPKRIRGPFYSCTRCGWRGWRSLTHFQQSGTDWCGCGRILPVSSFPFQSPIPFMRFDVTTTTVTTWTMWLRAHAHARSAYKLINKTTAFYWNVKAEYWYSSRGLPKICTSASRMLMTDAGALGTRGEYRPLLSLASGCQRESLDDWRHGGW